MLASVLLLQFLTDPSEQFVLAVNGLLAEFLCSALGVFRSFLIERDCIRNHLLSCISYFRRATYLIAICDIGKLYGTLSIACKPHTEKLKRTKLAANWSTPTIATI